MVLKSIT